MNIIVTEKAPATDAVSVEEAKTHCRVTHDRDDTYFAMLIDAAVEYAEEYTGRTFRTVSYELALPSFPCGPIELPKPPLQTITAVTYWDGTDFQTMDEDGYFVDDYAQPAQLYPAIDTSWPYTQTHPYAVRVAFDSGYSADLSDPNFVIPARAKQAMLVLIEEMYNVRGDTVFNVDTAKMELSQKLLGPMRLVAP